MVCYATLAFVSVALSVYDKAAAKSGAWRIPEAMFMLLGFVGGALPMYVTMKLIRHKTRHKKFMIGLPAEMVLHLIICVAASYLIFFTYVG